MPLPCGGGGLGERKQKGLGTLQDLEEFCAAVATAQRTEVGAVFGV